LVGDLIQCINKDSKGVTGITQLLQWDLSGMIEYPILDWVSDHYFSPIGMLQLHS